MRSNTFPTVADIFVLLAIYIGSSFLGAIPAMVMAFSGGIDQLEANLQSAIAATAPIVTGVPLILCILYGWKKLGRPSWRLGFENVTFGSGVLAIFGTLLVANGVTMVAEYLPGYEGFVEMMEEAMVPGWGMAIAVILVAPIFEEVLFRGVLARGYLRKTSPERAILYSGLFFGLMHLHPIHVFFAAIVGFALGFVYYRTRSLGLVILIHLINNGVSYYAGQQDVPDSTEAWLGISMVVVLELSAGLTALGVLLLWLLGNKFPLAPIPAEDLLEEVPVPAESEPLAP